MAVCCRFADQTLLVDLFMAACSTSSTRTVSVVRLYPGSNLTCAGRRLRLWSGGASATTHVEAGPYFARRRRRSGNGRIRESGWMFGRIGPSRRKG
jgi:hypothetical protein